MGHCRTGAVPHNNRNLLQRGVWSCCGRLSETFRYIRSQIGNPSRMLRSGWSRYRSITMKAFLRSFWEINVIWATEKKGQWAPNKEEYWQGNTIVGLWRFRPKRMLMSMRGLWCWRGRLKRRSIIRLSIPMKQKSRLSSIKIKGKRTIESNVVGDQSQYCLLLD